MPQIRLLHLDAAQLTAYRWNRARLEEEGRFPNEPLGYNAFGAYLQQRRSSTFHLLADAQEEGFAHELIPFVHGAGLLHPRRHADLAGRLLPAG